MRILTDIQKGIGGGGGGGESGGMIQNIHYWCFCCCAVGYVAQATGGVVD